MTNDADSDDGDIDDGHDDSDGGSDDVTYKEMSVLIYLYKMDRTSVHFQG